MAIMPSGKNDAATLTGSLETTWLEQIGGNENDFTAGTLVGFVSCSKYCKASRCEASRTVA
jgi:hypothetical protein